MNLLAQSKGRRSAWLAVLLLALAGVALVVAAPGARAAEDAEIPIPQLTLLPSNEVPPVDQNAIGYFSGSVAADHIDFDLSADGDTFTQAHFHIGAAGANGPVVAFLFGPVEGQTYIHPTGVIKEANLVGPLAGNFKGFLEALAKGEIYVNAHSVAHPGGVVRAQLPKITVPTPPSPTTPAGTPAATPKPPSTGSGIAAEDGFGTMEILGGVLLVMAAGSFVTLMAVRRRS